MKNEKYLKLIFHVEDHKIWSDNINYSGKAFILVFLEN